MSNNQPADIYLRQMNEVLSGFNEPKVLLHACCAPCSSFCLLSLRSVANIGVYFYNPNITVKDEYDLRLSELERLVGIYNDNLDTDFGAWHPKIKKSAEIDKNRDNNGALSNENGNANVVISNKTIEIVPSVFESDLFLSSVKGLEKCPERGERCSVCFYLRLRSTALKAKELGYDCFATTLTLSPLKNADVINAIGEKIAKEVDIKYLPTDFKKKNGYKMSIELSKEFNLYRQNYCGCVFSKNKEEFT